MPRVTPEFPIEGEICKLEALLVLVAYWCHPPRCLASVRVVGQFVQGFRRPCIDLVLVSLMLVKVGSPAAHVVGAGRIQHQRLRIGVSGK